MNYQVTVNGKQYSVELLQRGTRHVTFRSGGKTYEVQLDPNPSRPRFQAETTSSTHAPVVAVAKAPTGAVKAGAIVSPMPGVVVNILVAKGDTVKKGQSLLVVEAMKMENNVPAVRDGVVAEIHVKAGQEVAGNQVLITLG